MVLPGTQTPHTVAPSPAQLPSFGVPCMFLQSPGLGPFPVLYSPAIPGPISSAPGTHPNPGPMNFGLSTLASASHLLISPAAMVNPKPSTLPCTDPQLRCQPSLNLNPMNSTKLSPGAPEISCLFFPRAEIKDTCYHAWLSSMGVGDLNSSFHAYATEHFTN